jgi:BclB C-terminal domain-containing protein
LTTIAGGSAGEAALLPLQGVGSSLVSASETIDTTSVTPNVAESFPTSQTIEGITIYASTSSALNLIGSSVTIQAQLYISTTPNNVFTPVPGASVTAAPVLTGIIGTGTVFNGSTTGLSIPVAAQTRGMVVVTATANGLSLVNTVPVYVDVSLNGS